MKILSGVSEIQIQNQGVSGAPHPAQGNFHHG